MHCIKWELLHKNKFEEKRTFFPFSTADGFKKEIKNIENKPLANVC